MKCFQFIAQLNSTQHPLQASRCASGTSRLANWTARPATSPPQPGSVTRSLGAGTPGCTRLCRLALAICSGSTCTTGWLPLAPLTPRPPLQSGTCERAASAQLALPSQVWRPAPFADPQQYARPEPAISRFPRLSSERIIIPKLNKAWLSLFSQPPAPTEG